MCHCYAIVTGEDFFGHPEIMRSMHVHLLCVGVGQVDFDEKLVSSTEFLGDFGNGFSHRRNETKKLKASRLFWDSIKSSFRAVHMTN